MKTKILWAALFASAVMIAQANAGDYRARGGGSHGGAVTHAAPAAPVPARARGFSSMRSMPTRSFGGRMIYPGRRYSSIGMRSSRPAMLRRPSLDSNRATFTRSGPFTIANIRQGNRVARFANSRNAAGTGVWNQQNGGGQFRNGNNHLRADWQKHVFAHYSGDWHRDWNRHSDYWWNGHQCSFINGSWVIFNIGFDPWSPYWGYPDDYYAYGSPYNAYDVPYSYDYQPTYDNSGDYQGQMYYDQNSYPDQSQGYYDSSVYQTEAYDDPNSYGDESQSDYSIVVAAQERLAREGYYRGESDGAFGPEMRQALRRYQTSHGLSNTGYLDPATVTAMGLK